MQPLNIGDSSSACPQVVSLAIQPGATVTVSNLAASTGTISYFTALDLPAAGTIAAGANNSFTGPTWLTSAGISSVQITGPGY